jgi:hypothetical protein
VLLCAFLIVFKEGFRTPEPTLYKSLKVFVAAGGARQEILREEEKMSKVEGLGRLRQGT